MAGGVQQQIQNELQIDCEFPGGNIIVDRIDGDNVYLRQDLRDTEGHWFYWYFRVQGAAGSTLSFHFSDGDVIGVHGPAVSTDGGGKWSWLGREAVNGPTFRYTFPNDASEVRFSMGIPYLESNLREFLGRYAGHPALSMATLATSEGQRPVERIHLGCLGSRPRHRILLTCRHHCCEAMASYVLEGIMGLILSETSDGQWYQEHVESLVIPFVDKDGVEQGDQGKRRRPRDHNRDYSGESIYNSIRAIRRFVPEWSEGRLKLAMDLHCPALKGKHHEYIYMVGSQSPDMWRQQERFSRILEENQSSPLRFHKENNMPFGQGWNTGQNWTEGDNFSRWASGLDGIHLSTSIEIPYANASGTAVTPENARHFGHDCARAIRRYLESV